MIRQPNLAEIARRHYARHCARHLWWRFWWMPGQGLHFWYSARPVRIWGFDFVLQILIVAATVPGMWIAGGNTAEARWGFLVLLCSQPLWLFATWRKGQFGMFVIAVIYTGVWLRAVLNHF